MDSFSPEQIKKAARALSERYRRGETPYLRAIEDRHAYLVSRMPATQAALQRVFEELQGKVVESYLDIGAGPGASWEPVKERWPSLKTATFLEQDREFVKIGQERLLGEPIIWKHQMATSFEEMGVYDLVLFSYSWGEIKNLDVLQKSWQLCKQFLVIVEPGTPRGFEAMIMARDELIRQGGSVLAPCPHRQRCPWQGSSEWCHFGVRLQRSFELQRVKGGQLGYEDEKFSYIIMSRSPPPPFFGRMVRDSSKRKGHTLLTLCTSKGIETKIVSKKDKLIFKKVNKLKWGDKLIDSIQ